MPPTQVSPKTLPALQPETAHILFMDIVGYAKLTTNFQRFVQDDLRKVVQATPEYRDAQTRGELISRPKGDGMALLFFGDVLSPVHCAIQITRTLKTHPHVSVRMGIHTGPVLRVEDINAQSDIAGEGIVLAQRVMDLGDARHILVSGAYAAALGPIPVGHIYLTDLGPCQIKHGQSVRVFSLRDCHYGEPEYGNHIVPKKLRDDFDKRFRFVPAPSVKPNDSTVASLVNAVKIAALFALLLFILVQTCLLAAPNFVADVEYYARHLYHPGSPESPQASGPGTGKPIPNHLLSPASAALSTVPVPNVIGLTLDEARSAGLGVNFDAGKRTYSSDAQGTICRQSPASPGTMPKGKTISVWISLGERPNLVKVPNLFGLMYEDAEGHLKTISLKIDRSDIVSDSSLPAGTIYRQNPEPGKFESPGTTVHVRVSTGPPDSPPLSPGETGQEGGDSKTTHGDASGLK